MNPAALASARPIFPPRRRSSEPSPIVRPAQVTDARYENAPALRCEPTLRDFQEFSHAATQRHVDANQRDRFATTPPADGPPPDPETPSSAGTFAPRAASLAPVARSFAPVDPAFAPVDEYCDASGVSFEPGGTIKHAAADYFGPAAAFFAPVATILPPVVAIRAPLTRVHAPAGTILLPIAAIREPVPTIPDPRSHHCAIFVRASLPALLPLLIFAIPVTWHACRFSRRRDSSQRSNKV
jgi:hypothetical protein